VTGGRTEEASRGRTEEASRGRTEEASRGRETTERGSGDTDEDRERDMEKRGRTPEKPGTSIRGGSCRRRGTTTAQKLDKDFFAFESSFQQGHELD